MRTRIFFAALAIVLTIGARSQTNVSLWDIQYSPVDTCGAIPNSSYLYQMVNTGGIVTALSNGYGYWIQTSHATEWAAINIYDQTNTPSVGDSVTLTGKVIEWYNETEIDSVTNFTIVSHGNQALTPPTIVALDSIQKRKYQGMLIKVKDAIDVRYNSSAAWYVFSDSTMTKSVHSEDTVDNNSYTYTFSKGKRYNITGYVHHEYANWIEPRDINDIDSINVYPPNVSLWDIQYSTVDTCGAVPNSAYNNQNVCTGGIITGVDYKGYWLQTSHATEWAALFVYDKAYHPSVGDSVILTGLVTEYYNGTELKTITSFTTVSSGNQALTPPTIVAFDSIQKRKYQSLLVKVKDAQCVRYNAAQAWYVFSDSTITNSKPSEDTIDNDAFTYTFTQWKRYNITGCIQFEYANWMEPRNIYDIDSLNNTAIRNYQNDFTNIISYPNPNNGEFTLTIESLADAVNTHIKLYDLTGRLIYDKQLEINTGTNTIPISLNNLEKGTYFLQLTNDQSDKCNKIIVQ
jgi:predicted extracellular nuclease